MLLSAESGVHRESFADGSRGAGLECRERERSGRTRRRSRPGGAGRCTAGTSPEDGALEGQKGCGAAAPAGGCRLPCRSPGGARETGTTARRRGAAGHPDALDRPESKRARHWGSVGARRVALSTVAGATSMGGAGATSSWGDTAIVGVVATAGALSAGGESDMVLVRIRKSDGREGAGSVFGKKGPGG